MKLFNLVINTYYWKKGKKRYCKIDIATDNVEKSLEYFQKIGTPVGKYKFEEIIL